MITYTNVVRKCEPSLDETNTEGLLTETLARKVASIKVTVKVKNATGNVYLTDLIFQPGSIATGWSPHVSELEQVYL